MNVPPNDESLKSDFPGGRQTISLETIEPVAVPAQIKQKLLKKANDVIKKLNDKDPAMQEILDSDDAIKVPFFD